MTQVILYTKHRLHETPFTPDTVYTRQFATRSLLHQAITHHLLTPDTSCTKRLLHQTDVTPFTPNTCATHIPKMQRRPRTTSTSDRPRRARTLPHTSHKRPRLRRKMRARKRARTRPSVNATRPTQNGALPCDGGPRIPREASMLTATEIAPANATPHTSPAESPGTHNKKQRTPANVHGCGRPAEL